MGDWTVETENETVWLWIPQGADMPQRLNAGDAWDLGDDLMVGAEEVWARHQGTSPWMAVTSSTNPLEGFLVYAYGGVVVLDCDICKVWEQHFRSVDGNALVAVVNEAMEHRRLMHSDVAEDAEGEHEDGQAHPAQADPAGEVAGGQDQQDRGDDVENDR